MTYSYPVSNVASNEVSNIEYEKTDQSREIGICNETHVRSRLIRTVGVACSPVQCEAFGFGTVDSMIEMTAGNRERVTENTMNTETA